MFNPSQPPRKRQKRVKVQILTDRLRYYEALLQEQGIDPSKPPDTRDFELHRRSSQTALVPEESHLQTPSIHSEPSECINKTQIVHGQGRFNLVEK